MPGHTMAAKHAISHNSCTAAMHLALEAVGLYGCYKALTTFHTLERV